MIVAGTRIARHQCRGVECREQSTHASTNRNERARSIQRQPHRFSARTPEVTPTTHERRDAKVLAQKGGWVLERLLVKLVRRSWVRSCVCHKRLIPLLYDLLAFKEVFGQGDKGPSPRYRHLPVFLHSLGAALWGREAHGRQGYVTAAGVTG
jgi:hypothetical protein